MNNNIIIGVLTILVIVLGGISLFLVLERQSNGEIADKVMKGSREKFIVRTSPWKPYMYEEDGEYKGIAVELLDLVMNRLDIDYEFELVPWSRALKMAETGEVDALLSATYSEDRELFIHFTDDQLVYGREGKIPDAYLHRIEGAFLVKTIFRDIFVFESIENIASKKYRVGMSQGYAYSHPVGSGKNLGWNVVYHVTEEESVDALMNGEIDLFLTYKEVGSAVLNEMGLQDEISIAKGPPPFIDYQFILFSKNSDYPKIKEVQHLVDEELKKIHESEEFNEIYRKYTGEDRR